MGRISCRWKPEKNYLQSLIEVIVEELAHNVISLSFVVRFILLLPPLLLLLVASLHVGRCTSVVSRKQTGGRGGEGGGGGREGEPGKDDHRVSAA